MSNIFYRMTNSTGGSLAFASIAVFLLISIVLGLSTLIEKIVSLIPSSIKSWFFTNPIIGSLIITGIICSLGAFIGFIIWLIERRKNNGKTQFKWLA